MNWLNKIRTKVESALDYAWYVGERFGEITKNPKIVWLYSIKALSLQTENEKENMYKAVKYNNRSEALTALQKMVERKKEWIEKTEQEFAMLRENSTQRPV